MDGNKKDDSDQECVSLQDLMDIDTTHELKNRTWWWWWWICFFKNDTNPQRTKQFVVLWATRNCKRVRVLDHLWYRQMPVRKEDGRIRFEGLSASWYYDGKRMHDPLFIADGPMVSEWRGGSASLSLQNATSGFEGKVGNFRIFADFPDVRIDLKASEWTPFLTQVVPSGKEFLGHLGYKMFKIRGSKVEGIIQIGDLVESVKGTAYFQKVRINSITSPWYWGVFHTENGSYVDYFMPHIGPPALRRSVSHRSCLDWGEWILSRSWQFYDSSTDRVYKIKRVRMRKRYENDLPVFELAGEEGANRIRMTMEAYTRAYWRVEQPLLGFLSTVLYYNEYPVNVTEFDFRSGSRRVQLEDISPIWGNCEHAWGIV